MRPTIEKPEGMEGMVGGTWGLDRSWMLDPIPVASITTVPRILVVDDDPLFCKRMRRAAKSKNIPLTVCKSTAELATLPHQMPFDVAILDYYFGALTAHQVAHLVGEEVPIIIISNTEAFKIAGDHWPDFVRSFVHKSRGIEAILAEALLTARWGHLIPDSSKSPPLARFYSGHQLLFYLLPVAAVVITSALITWAVFYKNIALPMTPIRWDRNMVNPNQVIGICALHDTLRT